VDRLARVWLAGVVEPPEAAGGRIEAAANLVRAVAWLVSRSWWADVAMSGESIWVSCTSSRSFG
jgi:hypothetical protein